MVTLILESSILLSVEAGSRSGAEAKCVGETYVEELHVFLEPLLVELRSSAREKMKRFHVVKLTVVWVLYNP